MAQYGIGWHWGIGFSAGPLWAGCSFSGSRSRQKSKPIVILLGSLVAFLMVLPILYVVLTAFIAIILCFLVYWVTNPVRRIRKWLQA